MVRWTSWELSFQATAPLRSIYRIVCSNERDQQDALALEKMQDKKPRSISELGQAAKKTRMILGEDSRHSTNLRLKFLASMVAPVWLSRNMLSAMEISK